MKLLSILLLCASTLFGGEFTNGVFYIDAPMNGLIVSQTGELTNKFEAGGTYEVGNRLIELRPIQKSTIFFSDGPIISTDENSIFTISIFDQEVENINAKPQKAQFGTHVLGLSLVKGEFSIVYPNTNTNSAVNINTYYSDYELKGGNYYFRITGKSALVYVLEGNMNVHGGSSKPDSVNKGNLSLAIPFSDSDSGLDDKFINSFKKARPDEMERFTAPVLDTAKTIGNVGFFIIDGKIVGISLK